MFEQMNEVSVLVTAILGVAVGSIWYSPLLFGAMWMRAAGITSADLRVSGTRVVEWLVGALIANLVLFCVLAQFIMIAEKSGTSVWMIGFYVLIFLTASLSSAVIWEKRPIAYLCIHSGYTAIVVFGGLAVLAYWPW